MGNLLSHYRTWRERRVEARKAREAAEREARNENYRRRVDTLIYVLAKSKHTTWGANLMPKNKWEADVWAEAAERHGIEVKDLIPSRRQ